MPSHNCAIEIEGMWIIERPDGTRVEPTRGGAFKTKAVAEAVIEYMESPKPVMPSCDEARLQPRDAKENKRLKQLAEKRDRDRRVLRFALLRKIAAKRGLQWTPEHGFEHVE